jgi:phage-related protein
LQKPITVQPTNAKAVGAHSMGHSTQDRPKIIVQNVTGGSVTAVVQKALQLASNA